MGTGFPTRSTTKQRARVVPRFHFNRNDPSRVGAFISELANSLERMQRRCAVATPIKSLIQDDSASSFAAYAMLDGIADYLRKLPCIS